MKTLGYFYISASIIAVIISYFCVQSLVYKNPFVDHCKVNELAKELFKPIREKIEESKECGENEVYHIANVTDYCQLGCKSGCYCKKGYLRNKYDECVTAEEEGKTCKKNEELTCGKKDCEPMCDIDQDQLCYLNRFSCMYSYHCTCKKGYIRLDDGPCIKIEECPLKIYQTPEYHEL
ncbi:hypothetical protein PVAND_012323 [Polypedilum vanderplanki]|uniref:TIL domain-containing protein n=1 Tax=Polypedilum vanderplanki TaxID=319348 RepID=A0A9J6CM27_POLVA|nr:hypothetical protein PVAND_012323 [Polypedilum vanderplanki]